MRKLPERPPAPEKVHRVVRIDRSEQVTTGAITTRLVCNCGKASLYEFDQQDAEAQMAEHHRLVNEGIIPNSLKCPYCDKGKVTVQAIPPYDRMCRDCEGSGIRRDIPTAVGPLGESL